MLNVSNPYDICTFHMQDLAKPCICTNSFVATHLLLLFFLKSFLNMGLSHCILKKIIFSRVVDMVDINALCKYQAGPSQKYEDLASNMIDI